jgi:hypothetical protein
MPENISGYTGYCLSTSFPRNLVVHTVYEDAEMERIDTHAHVVPEVWRKYCIEHGFGRPDGMPAIPVRFFSKKSRTEGHNTQLTVRVKSKRLGRRKHTST